MSATALPRAGYKLDDRYTAESGEVMLDGIQAIVRMLLDVRRLDQQRGLNTGIYVSGYQGSPLGGLDRELQRVSKLTDAAGIVFHPGLNEELAATAVGGTQLLTQLDGRRKQGVTGFWYGKSPGLDRAADAIRHANLSGTATLGGAVALIGDDPTSKSSTVPSSCEPMCRSLAIPLLAPGNVAEVVELGLHAVAISRYAGTWTALKIVSDLADSSGALEVGEALKAIPELAEQPPRVPPVMLPPSNLRAEENLFTERLMRAQEYARSAGLNRVTFEPEHPRIGLMAAGMGYEVVLRTFTDLGLEQQDLEALGVRLIQLQMPWPLEASVVRELVDGLETVLVVEDKLPFIESIVKESLYRTPRPPVVLGKRDAEDRPLLPYSSAVFADDVAAALMRILPNELIPDQTARRYAERTRNSHKLIDNLIELPVLETSTESTEAKRTPYFCSGCPHNTSTRAGADELVGVGIGCHTMVTLDSGDHRRGRLLGMPQMGGEGAQWLGLQHFTDEDHFIQNIGDGTFHHSGSLAIRAAIAADANMTYRLLYNDAVAMTGGQQPEGKMSVPQIVSELAAEGVKQIIITTPEPERYRGVKLAPIASVRHRDHFDEAQAELKRAGGVTVLIHDDRCATEKRRMRKRGTLPKVNERVWINERVCEGCGDCGEQSSCLSVLPVQTDYGRKTQIHQSSCNSDMTCLKGDCPSFLLVTRNEGGARDSGRQATIPPGARATPAPPTGLPEPVLRVPQEMLVRMPGVGGTGVVTVAAILRTAAFLQGLEASGLDQIGLAQKGGPVVSDLRISNRSIPGQVRASCGAVDVLLGFDLLGSADPATIESLSRQSTVAILNTDVTPTAMNIVDPALAMPSPPRLVARVRRATRADETVTINAEMISEELFGDHMPANLLLVGAAYQHGCLPLAAEAIERAITLNGAAVETNIAAFRWGRALIADPDSLVRAIPDAVGHSAGAATAPASAVAAGDASDPRAEEPLAELIARRAAELTAYEDAAYARRYTDAVHAVAFGERARLGTSATDVTRAYANGLFKLMAYKDEYEVARLHLDTIERARLQAEFGDDAKIQILLHPPILRALGMDRKLKLGRSAAPLMRSLKAGRRLRGTRLDPFGQTEMRRMERALIDEYSHLVDSAVQQLSPQNGGVVKNIALLPDMVRGYEHIKVANVERMRARAAELLTQLATASIDVERDSVRAA